MRSLLVAVTAPLALASSIEGGHLGSLPPPPGPRGARTAVQAAIEAKPVCIGSSVDSAGTLGDVLYYRATELPDGRVAVGYFVFFSEERPWGNNWLTWSVVPALAIDMVYSRALLVAPGLQRAMYGAGDVEGVAVFYDVRPDGSLSFDHANADDGNEHPVLLSRERAFALDPEHPVFYSDVWSHQLSGSGAASRQNLAYLRCYEGDSIRPLPDDVARVYRIENRADPAHVERLDGVAIR
jgi:hypothetical protein